MGNGKRKPGGWSVKNLWTLVQKNQKKPCLTFKSSCIYWRKARMWLVKKTSWPDKCFRKKTENKIKIDKSL